MKPTSTNEAHPWLPALSLFKAAAIRVHSGLLPEGTLLTPRFALTFAFSFALTAATRSAPDFCLKTNKACTNTRYDGLNETEDRPC